MRLNGDLTGPDEAFDLVRQETEGDDDFKSISKGKDELLSHRRVTRSSSRSPQKTPLKITLKPQSDSSSGRQRRAVAVVSNYYKVDWKAGGAISKAHCRNDKSCCVCLGKGRRFPTIECASCDRVFHAACAGNKRTDKCPVCTAVSEKEKRTVPSIKLVVGRFNSGPRPYRGFVPLIEEVSELFPQAFELPDWLVDEFDGLFKHPETGSYMDSHEYTVHVGPPPKAPAEDVLPLCYQCGRSGGFPWTTDIELYRHLDEDGFQKLFSASDASVRVRAQRSDLVQCDFCSLWWHLDCLDPPLAFRPHCLLPTNFQAEKFSLAPTNRTRCETKTAAVSDAQLSNLEKLISKFHKGHGPPPKIISWRKKWMCPCHADRAIRASFSGVRSRRKFRDWRWIQVEELDDEPRLRKRFKNACKLALPSEPASAVGSEDESFYSSQQARPTRSLACESEFGPFESKVAARTVASANSGDISVALASDASGSDEPFLWPTALAREEFEKRSLEIEQFSSRIVVPERVIQLDFFSAVMQSAPPVAPCKLHSEQQTRLTLPTEDQPMAGDDEVSAYLDAMARFVVDAHDMWLHNEYQQHSAFETPDPAARLKEARASESLFQMKQWAALRDRLSLYDSYFASNPDAKRNFLNFVKQS